MAVFLGQDGILAMGNKTPVTILQETFQKKGITPQYDLIYNGTGTLEPIFKFRVSAADYSAIGDGKTKKAAKHDAAAALLKRMLTNKAVTENEHVKATEEIDFSSPYAGAIKENFVGMLDEVCVINKVPLPVFKEVKEEGPPHARVFTMQCVVGNVRKVAVARTKKQAKHLAAQRMISKIVEILGEKYVPIVENNPDEDIDGDSKSLQAPEFESFKEDLAIPISELQNVFFNRADEIIPPKMFLDLSNEPEEFYEKMENPVDFLDLLMKKLGGKWKCITMSQEEFQSAVQEVEEHLENFYSNRGETCYDDEDTFSDDNQDEQIDSNENENDLKTVNYVLKEFDLKGSEEELSKLDSEIITNCDSPKEEVAYLHLVSCSEELYKSDLRDNIYVFLSAESPQGSWVFIASSETNEEAKKLAAIKALRFFRCLSIPKIIKNSDKKSS